MTTSSSGYENAPSTILLATACAYCARPLRDADSVQAGVGPDCRKKHGVGVPVGEPDWTAAGKAIIDTLLHAPLTERVSAAFEARDAHTLANGLIHAVAVHQRGPAAAGYIIALLALGYTEAGRALAERLGAVHVTRDGDELAVRGPYSDAFVARARRIRGRKFIRATLTNRFPVAERAAVWTAIVESYPGALVFGDRGVSLAVSRLAKAKAAA